MIPGANVLNTALSVIASEEITYYKYLSRGPNDVGQDVTVFDDPITIYGSFQPIPKKLYQQLGLDLQKSFWTLYTSNDVFDIARDISGDQIEFQGNRYQCQSDSEWFAVDGWKAIICVLILDFS